MDIARPDLRRSRRRRTFLLGVSAAVVLGMASLALSRLKPALPTVDAAVWTDTVKRGPMVRQVRGPGSLVPREDRLRLIPAETEATVLRIRVLPGAHVEPDTVLMDLVDPSTQQQLLDAQLQLRSAEAEMKNTHARLDSDLMTQRAAAATVGADQHQAQLQAQTDKSLFDLGVISGLTYSASRGKADELSERNSLEHQRLALNGSTVQTQLAVAQTKVDEAKAMLALRDKQQAALRVRAGISGVLVDLPHQVGEHVDPGTNACEGGAARSVEGAAEDSRDPGA